MRTRSITGSPTSEVSEEFGDIIREEAQSGYILNSWQMTGISTGSRISGYTISLIAVFWKVDVI